jgi:hypothetical protein
LEPGERRDRISDPSLGFFTSTKSIFKIHREGDRFAWMFAGAGVQANGRKSGSGGFFSGADILP